jgi:hypothetical protein
MRRLRVLFFLVTLLAASSAACSTAAATAKLSTTMDSWVGHNTSELVTAWGPPTESQDIGGGQRVLTWRYWTKPFGSDGYWVYRMFTVKPDGTILSWRWKGLQQP